MPVDSEHDNVVSEEPTAGARFYTCALQVNPYSYLVRHAKETPFTDEESYDVAIVEACLQRGIDVVGVTDHYRIATSRSLINALTAAGVIVFPGFEAVSKDGVHFLCLFAPDTPDAAIDRCIGECGVIQDDSASPSGKFDAEELMEAASRWGAASIAAHVAAAGGLLNVLSGQAAMRTWKSEHLYACALAGPVRAAPQNFRAILKNTDPQYRRRRPVAVVNASDVSQPGDLASRNTTTYIKMSKVGLDGLRQAFLDPDSRIRLLSDPEPPEKTEFKCLDWNGGFLDGLSIRFNENLNVLVGGPGSGKSTVIESIRHVLGLQPVGPEAKKIHESMVSQVLRAGTRITLQLRSPHPAPRTYIVERTIPHPPVVKAEDGEILPLRPLDITPRVEVYGQHEISEIARSPQERTRLLHRFVDTDQTSAARVDILRQLPEVRKRLEMSLQRLAEIEDELAAYPSVAETLRRYEEAGLEERLKEKSLLVREDQLLKTSEESIDDLRRSVEELGQLLAIDTSFLGEEVVSELPNAAEMSNLRGVLTTLSTELEQHVAAMSASIERAVESSKQVQANRQPHITRIEAAYEKTLRELQKDNVDANEFIRLRQRIERLEPLREELPKVKRAITKARKERNELVVALEDARAAEFRELERAAKSVTRKLAPRVRVSVRYQGDRDPLLAKVRSIGGRLNEACATLKALDRLSLRSFAETCRKGADALVSEYGFLPNQAAKIAGADEITFMDIEELELPPTTELELNVASEGDARSWQPLEALSTGQKATAVLLLLLLESDAPLIVDQPEDDLGSRFITDGVVPRMREEKRRRQFIFSTHNANIPVLGDAELIVGLTATGEAPHGQAAIQDGHRGSIDLHSVCALVEELLEGGEDAFELRRLKYGIGT